MLTNVDREEAHALYEAARDDNSFSDAELVACASEFNANFQSDASIFGRLAADLMFLCDVFTNPSSSPAERAVARAALTYFAVVEDAVPDDLGAVGILDDAFIVHYAVQQIRPERAAVADLLDKVVNHWPFVRNVVFEAGEQRYPLSEYMLLNAALLLNEVCPADSCGVALITPESGPLSFVIGFVRALAEVRTLLSRGPQFFSTGERIRNSTTRAEAFFEKYCAMTEKGDFVDAPSRDATHFSFKTSRRGGSEITNFRPIQDIANFTRSGRTGGTLRKGTPAVSGMDVKLGPLERLFGSTSPVVQAQLPVRVLIVAPLVETFELARSMSLFGTPLTDVISISQVRLLSEEFDERLWNSDGAGGKPLLTIVRSATDALAYVEDSGHEFLAVVANTRRASNDPQSLSAIRKRGIAVIAICDESDSETRRALNSEGFTSWKWDDKWFGSLRWPERASAASHPIQLHEYVASARSRMHVHVVEVPFAKLADLHRALERLELLSEGSESIDDFTGEAYAILVSFCRLVTPLEDALLNDMMERIEELTALARANSAWWIDEVTATAGQVAEGFLQALDDLLGSNAKFDALNEWFATNPKGLIFGNRRMISSLNRTLPVEALREKRQKGILPEHGLIPAWLARDRMDTLLVPPAAESLTVLLYPPEVTWYMRRQKRLSLEKRNFERASTKTPFTNLNIDAVVTSDSATFASPPDYQPPMDERLSQEPDDLVNRARRAHVIRSLASDTETNVDARLVYFAGGYWAAFAPTRQLQVVHLRDSEVTAELRETSVEDLSPGDVAVLVKNSDRDALREAVDTEIPEELRRHAVLWQIALRNHVTSGRRIEDLQKDLAKVGCTRTLFTIKKWLDDDSIIGPRDAAADVAAIARVTSDAALKANIDACTTAIAELRGWHMRVANRIAEQVLSEAKQWLDIGASASELIDINDRIVAAVVEHVDANIVRVNRRVLNRLTETPWRT